MWKRVLLLAVLLTSPCDAAPGSAPKTNQKKARTMVRPVGVVQISVWGVATDDAGWGRTGKRGRSRGGRSIQGASLPPCLGVLSTEDGAARTVMSGG